MVDDPEAARRATQAVFGLTPELRISSALQHFQRRYGRLCSRAVWNGPVAVEERDQLEHPSSTRPRHRYQPDDRPRLPRSGGKLTSAWIVAVG